MHYKIQFMQSIIKKKQGNTGYRFNTNIGSKEIC